MSAAESQDAAVKLLAFAVEYEKRHAQLEGRVSVIETQLAALASREDVVLLKGTLDTFKATMQGAMNVFDEASKRFELASAAMATKQDVEWLKRAFWWGMGLLSGVLLFLAGLLASHLLVK